MTDAERLAMDAIVYAAEMVKSYMQEVTGAFDAPHVRMRPKVYPDGDQWCALYGENLQEGVCGFGNTPVNACYDFDKNWCSQTLLDGVIAAPCYMSDAGRDSLSRDLIRALTPADLAALVAEKCWQPIETAPKDGTSILSRNDEYGIRETYWRFYGEGSPAKGLFDKGHGPSGAWNWSEPQNHWASSWKPTHWMPLPAAPAPGGK